jgi:hypothetical protein
MPRVNPHLNYKGATHHSPKMILNPIVLVCAPPYAKDHAYTHTVTSPYITDDPQRASFNTKLNN